MKTRFAYGVALCAAMALVGSALGCSGLRDWWTQRGEEKRASQVEPPAVSATGPSVRLRSVQESARGEAAAGRRAAMFSVVFHARAPADLEVPREFRPMPINEAARFLANEEGRFRVVNRRRAIAILAGADFERFRDPLEILGAPIEEIFVLFRTHPRWNVHERQNAVQRLLDAAGPAVAGCAFTKVAGPFVATTPDPNTLQAGCPTIPGNNRGVTEATMTMTARGPFSQVPALMDPQNWDQCSDFFDPVYAAEPDTQGQPSIDPTTHYALEDPTPPTPGTDWEQILFERFLIDWKKISLLNAESELLNVLAIKSDFETGAYSARYCLHTSIWHDLVGIGTGPGGIDVDEGETSAKLDSAGDIEIEGVKYIRFSGLPYYWDEWLNLTAGFYMEAAGAEIEKMLCCEVASDGDGESPDAPGRPVIIP